MKSDYTKVERILEEGLRNIGVKELLRLADLAAGMGSRTPYAPDSHSTAQFAIIIKTALNWLERQDPDIYHKLGVKRKETRHLLDHPQTIKPADLEQLQQLKVKIDAHKAAILKKMANNSDDKLVDLAREKHIHKRFNVNERWLPLK